MGGFDQQHQRVKGDQYNAEGDIYQSRNNHYQAQGDIYNDHRHYTEYNGRDRAGRDIVYRYETNVDTSGYKSIGRSIGLIGLLSFLLFAGLIGGGIWFVSTGHVKIPNLAANPSSSLDQMLYGTPPDTLKQFCHDLQSGDLQGAYDIYSSHLKSQISLDQFTNQWTNNIPGSCTSNITTSSATSANGTIHTTHKTLATMAVVL